jgi:hypothetical protein
MNYKIHRLAILLIVFFTHFTKVNSQNLVPYPSFELANCGITPKSVAEFCSWFKPVNDGGTPDGFENDSNASFNNFPCHRLLGQNTWAGNAYTPFGNRFLGMLMYYPQGGQVDSRENASTLMTDSLIAGENYKVGFYLKFGNRSKYTVNHIGLKLSNDTLICGSNFHLIKTMPTVESVVPMADSTGWTKIETIYNAHGGEKFLTLGVFYPDSSLQISINPLYQPSDTLCLLGKYGGYYFFDSV